MVSECQEELKHFLPIKPGEITFKTENFFLFKGEWNLSSRLREQFSKLNKITNEIKLCSHFLEITFNILTWGNRIKNYALILITNTFVAKLFLQKCDEAANFNDIKFRLVLFPHNDEDAKVVLITFEFVCRANLCFGYFSSLKNHPRNLLQLWKE